MPLHAAMLRLLAASSLELPEDPPFLIEHQFNAPVETVWTMHVDPIHLQRWWKPGGMMLSRMELDLQPGGICSYQLDAPGAPTVWNRWIYRDIEPARRLTALGSFIDDRGRTIRNPLDRQWPLRFFCVLTFEALDHSSTRLTCQASPWNASETDHLVFHAGRDSLCLSFQNNWQQLATYLNTLSSLPSSSLRF